MSYTQLKNLSNLFNRIFYALDGNRYFTTREKRENEKHFIYSVIYRDYNVLLTFIDNLNDGVGNDDIVKDLKNIMYKFI